MNTNKSGPSHIDLNDNQEKGKENSRIETDFLNALSNTTTSLMKLTTDHCFISSRPVITWKTNWPTLKLPNICDWVYITNLWYQEDTTQGEVLGTYDANELILKENNVFLQDSSYCHLILKADFCNMWPWKGLINFCQNPPRTTVPIENFYCLKNVKSRWLYIMAQSYSG